MLAEYSGSKQEKFGGFCDPILKFYGMSNRNTRESKVELMPTKSAEAQLKERVDNFGQCFFFACS